MTTFKDDKGFTLIEVMVTIVILMVGIMAMNLMQIDAIRGSSTAFARSNANAVALTFLEELRRIPFGSANLTAGTDPNTETNLNAGAVPAGQFPDFTVVGNFYDPAANDDLDALDNLFTVDGNFLVDRAGRQFQLFWNVANTTINVGGASYTPYCTIRLYMYWNTPYGANTLEITTIKHNNLKV